ncbi:MAG: hypothetical protein ACI8QC_001791 [Planctomycetota bacterium]|jgi:hypothetical protein
MLTNQLRALLLATLMASCVATTTLPLAHSSPLDWTHGEWTGVRREKDSGETHPMRVRVTPILGGAGQLREMWVEGDNGTYRGMSIQLNETETDQWTRTDFPPKRISQPASPSSMPARTLTWGLCSPS